MYIIRPLTGHQKKIMLAIDRLKRLHGSGRRLSGMEPAKPPSEALEPASSYPTPHWLTDSGGGTLVTPPVIPSHGPPPRNITHYTNGPKRSTSGDNIAGVEQEMSRNFHSTTQDDSVIEGQTRVLKPGGDTGYNPAHQPQNTPYFAKQDNHPDVVAIQVNRSATGRSMDSLDTDHGPQPHSNLQYQSFQGGTLNR